MNDDAQAHDSALWDAHAQSDPLWAVLSLPEKRGGGWTLHEFMQHGEREIAALSYQLEQLHLSPGGGPVLDFGCGVGRLSQALGRRFDDVTGADISPGMIALARKLNRYPDRVKYLCTAETGIDTLPARSFNFIYSNIVLQHVAPELAVRYLSEFFRLLRPNGLLVFQLPSHRQSPGELEIVPMTEDAYRGTVALASTVPSVVSPGEEMNVPILVRNTSTRTWSQPGAGPMAAGNHWLDGSGATMLHQDDGRAPLPQMLRGGTECKLVLRMRAPSEPGRYVAEIDLVHEGVTWFERKGSPTLRFPIEVSEGVGAADDRIPLKEFQVPEYPEGIVPSPNAGDVTEAEPFPMNAVPHDEVVALIARHGGRLVHLEEDRRAGPDWVSYAYFVSGPA